MASIEPTMHCDPKRRAAAVMNALSLIAAVLIATCAHRHRTGRHTCDHCASTQAQRRDATMGIPYGMVQYDIGCHTKFYQDSRVQLTLSAPALSTSWMSSRVRSPPPTQSGTYTPFEIVFLRSAFPFRRG